MLGLGADPEKSLLPSRPSHEVLQVLIYISSVLWKSNDYRQAWHGTENLLSYGRKCNWLNNYNILHTFCNFQLCIQLPPSNPTGHVRSDTQGFHPPSFLLCHHLHNNLVALSWSYILHCLRLPNLQHQQKQYYINSVGEILRLSQGYL